MSGQYKIGLIILLAICGFIFPLANGVSAQDGNSCFPHKTLYTTEPVEMRRTDSYLGEWVGKTAAGKVYTVREVKNAPLFGSCWIRISGGWLLRRAGASAIKAGSPKPKRQTTSTTNTTSTSGGRECHSTSRAYVTGTMNIRSGPGTSYRKVGSASAGGSFAVLDSRRGNDYCWLKMSKGWVAQTGRIRNTRPVVRTATTSVSSTNTAGLPQITGGATCRNKIIKAWNYLRARSSKWFSYAINANFSRIECSYRTGVTLETRVMEINTTRDVRNDVEISSVFVHEACHLRQWDEGRHHGRTKIDRENECYNKQADAVSEYAPHARSWIASLRRGIPGYSR